MVAELGSCQLIAPNTSPASSCVFPLISDGSPASQMSNPLTVLFDPSNFLSVHGKTAQASIPRDATDEKLNTINTQEVTSGWVNWKSVSIWGGEELPLQTTLGQLLWAVWKTLLERSASNCGN